MSAKFKRLGGPEWQRTGFKDGPEFSPGLSTSNDELMASKDVSNKKYSLIRNAIGYHTISAIAQSSSAIGVLQNQADLARYCHLPVGNMSGDWVLATADAIFARCLRDAGFLLWIADPSLPHLAVHCKTNQAAEELLENTQLTMEVSFFWKTERPLYRPVSSHPFIPSPLQVCPTIPLVKQASSIPWEADLLDPFKS